MSTVSALGKPIASYKLKTINMFIHGIETCLLGVLGAYWLWDYGYWAFDLFRRGELGTEFDASPLYVACGVPFMLLLSFAALASGIYGLYQIVITVIEKPYLIVYENGVLVKRSDGLQRFLWQDFDDILTRSLTRLSLLTTSKTIYKAGDGRDFYVNFLFQNRKDLQEYLEDRIADYVIPKQIRHFQQEGALKFGKLRVDRAGVRIRRTTVKWAEIDSIYIQQLTFAGINALTVSYKNRRKTVSMDAFYVPNISIAIRTVKAIIAQIPAKSK
ncbi:MAG: hypothetical protein RLP44_01120 [Aggregatilineales bacterium]